MQPIHGCQISLVLDQWFHIVGTYSSQSKKAKIYINGNLNKQGVGNGGLLSQDWESYAGFGRHPKGAMQAYDIVDELYMYSRELSPYEVKMLHQACNFGNARKRKFTKHYVIFTYVMAPVFPLITVHADITNIKPAIVTPNRGCSIN